MCLGWRVGEWTASREHNRDFCVSFYFRKVNKCYRGRSCPIIVHCRQVQLPPRLEKRSPPRCDPPAPRPSRPVAESSSSLAAPKAPDTRRGLRAVWLKEAVRACGRARPLTSLRPSLGCSPNPDPGRGLGPRHARPRQGAPLGGRDAHRQGPSPTRRASGPAGELRAPAPGRELSRSRAAGRTGFPRPSVQLTLSAACRAQCPLPPGRT